MPAPSTPWEPGLDLLFLNGGALGVGVTQSNPKTAFIHSLGQGEA